MSSLDSSSEGEEVDFNVYRKEYECEEHWKLRRSFMQTFWDDIETEEEVQCCAQLFVNIEFLGCKYSKEVMERIAHMANQVPEIRRHRQSRRDSLKRCFVQAQDAVAAKYQKIEPKKSTQVPKEEEEEEVVVVEQENEMFKPKELTVKEVQSNTVNRNIRDLYLGINAQKILSSDEEMEINMNSGWDDEDREAFKKTGNKQTPLIKFTPAEKAENLRNLLKDAILFDNGDESDMNWTLNKTVAMMRKVGKVDMKFDAKSKQYIYLFNDQIIGEGVGESKKLAKKAADEDFIKTLRENCYTIRSKVKYFSIEEVIQKSQGSNSTAKVSQDEQKLKESNLGFKMLKMLGWKGGSLGSKDNGIIDPINLEIRVGRLGLGSDTETFDPNYFRNLLKNYQRQNLEYDLIFSSDFTKEERAQIHQMASQLNLKTKSYGKSEGRHLVISTKISPTVLRQKLIEGDNYLREKYDILPPLLQEKKSAPKKRR